jgi:hypothetical protein
MTGRNFNPQQWLQDSTYDLAANPHSAITNQQFSGGGEGIRTPDPRVANAVLCQLSYTPETLPIGDCRLPISRALNSNWHLAIGNRQ